MGGIQAERGALPAANPLQVPRLAQTVAPTPDARRVTSAGLLNDWPSRR
jgi:hypothetical protein